MTVDVKSHHTERAADMSVKMRNKALVANLNRAPRQMVNKKNSKPLLT